MNIKSPVRETQKRSRLTKPKAVRCKPKLPFRVWIEQVNQTYVDVKAADVAEAHAKAVRKWRREDAQAHVTDIRQQ